MCRELLASGTLGSHHGSPVKITIGTTLAELKAEAGIATTGGGSWLPISDVVRMAADAQQYLAVFKNPKEIKLYYGRSKRIATPAQRQVLQLIDGGCSHPGCTVPADKCEAHHITPWAKRKRTDITDLTLACGPHHQLADQDWTIRKRHDGITEWWPPPHQDHGQPRTNNYHRPQRYLKDLNDDEEE
jgi:hypothetical protein